MPPRQAPTAPPPRRAPRVPRCWLMIDARLGEATAAAVRALPPRSAVVVRPYAMADAGRPATIRAIRRLSRARRHLLLIAGAGPVAGFDGRHGDARRGAAFRSMAVHDAREAARARRCRADAVLVSPVWPTRSHPGAATLGRAGFARLAASARAPAIALGGMDADRFRRLRAQGAHGWAAIDAWLRERR